MTMDTEQRIRELEDRWRVLRESLVAAMRHHADAATITAIRACMDRILDERNTIQTPPAGRG